MPACHGSCVAINTASMSLRRTIRGDRKSTRLNSSHLVISYAVFCLKKKKKETNVLALHDSDVLRHNHHLPKSDHTHRTTRGRDGTTYQGVYHRLCGLRDEHNDRSLA